MADYSSVAPPAELSGGVVMAPPTSAPPATANGSTGGSVDVMAAIRKAKERAAQLKQEAAEGKKRKRDEDDERPDPAKQPQLQQDGIFSLITSNINIDGNFSEEYYMPNNNIGRVIGKGGEQINRIQDMSLCRIQIAQDNGTQYRNLSLTGPREAITAAKKIITDIVQEGMMRDAGLDPSGLLPSGEPATLSEIAVPSNRVGLIIGRQGETIQRLQAESGARLQMIQEPGDTSATRPLKISGTAEQVAHAERLVNDMLTEGDPLALTVVGDTKALVAAGGNNFNGAPLGSVGGPDNEDEYRSQVREIEVPRWAVGSVIGRGGDTIKRIQSDSGARVQFNSENDSADFRICTVAGTSEMVRYAEKIVNQIIQEAEARNNESRDRRNSSGGQYGPPGGGGGGHYGPPGGGGSQKRISVPAQICGLVIGRGGESIKEIQARSGCHVELDRNHAPDAKEKDFVLKGTDSQIEEAERLINLRLEEDRDRRARMPDRSSRGGPHGRGGGMPPAPYGGMPPGGMPPPHMFGGPPPMMGGPMGMPPPGMYGGPQMMGGQMGYGNQAYGAPQPQAGEGMSQPPLPTDPPPSDFQENPSAAPPAENAVPTTSSAPAGGATPAPGYPTDAEYQANKAWYNSQGYYGVPPSADAAPSTTESTTEATTSTAAASETASAAGNGGAPAPGYPTEAEYQANKEWYNSQGYYGVVPQQ